MEVNDDNNRKDILHSDIVFIGSPSLYIFTELFQPKSRSLSISVEKALPTQPELAFPL